jgi:hypothetical protein
MSILGVNHTILVIHFDNMSTHKPWLHFRTKHMELDLCWRLMFLPYSIMLTFWPKLPHLPVLNSWVPCSVCDFFSLLGGHPPWASGVY